MNEQERKPTHRITVEVDDDDYRDICREVAFRQRIQQPLPGGDGCTLGRSLGEIVRDLWEYRGLKARMDSYTGEAYTHPPMTPGVNDGWGPFSEDIDDDE